MMLMCREHRVPPSKPRQPSYSTLVSLKCDHQPILWFQIVHSFQFPKLSPKTNARAYRKSSLTASRHHSSYPGKCITPSSKTACLRGESLLLNRRVAPVVLTQE